MALAKLITAICLMVIGGLLLAAPVFIPPIAGALSRTPDPNNVVKPTGVESAIAEMTPRAVPAGPGQITFYGRSGKRILVNAESLLGWGVYDLNDDVVGEVEDVVVSTEQGIDGVVIGVGGFLGIGEKTVTTPLNELSFVQGPSGDPGVVLSMRKDELEAAPEIKLQSGQTTNSDLPQEVKDGTAEMHQGQEAAQQQEEEAAQAQQQPMVSAEAIPEWVRALKDKRYRLLAPERLSLSQIGQVVLLIDTADPNTFEAFAANVGNQERTGTLRTSSVMEAELASPAFTKEPEERVARRASILGPTRWDWYIVPNRGGELPVTVRVFARPEVLNSEAPGELSLVKEEKILVSVSLGERLALWADGMNRYSGLMALVGLPLTGFGLYISYRSWRDPLKPQKNPEAGNFGSENASATTETKHTPKAQEILKTNAHSKGPPAQPADADGQNTA